jgi:hypothetical protein
LPEQAILKNAVHVHQIAVHMSVFPYNLNRAEPVLPIAHAEPREYQIALLCDNFFLLGVTSEITLANAPHQERDESPISLED